ncbi:MAG TPA: DNA adenine methylase [Candidatus Angelobacter sp.]|jgi:DNA adenine methylase|nr:DNA adenine methylase [Candidatus Angelobacter sp.]
MMKSKNNSVVNTSAVPNPSPFRYPGGKSWLIPYVRQWLVNIERPVHFVEPFAGGANVGLTVALENLAEHVTLIELDKDIAAVWQTILGNQANKLTKMIVNFPISKRAVRAALKGNTGSQLSRAFNTLLKNRVRRGGIMTEDASLLNLGENGRGVKSRWYPETLEKRIDAISQHRKKISFFWGDGLEFIRNIGKTQNLAFFIDPPYAGAGQRLYRHFEIDHRKLFETVAELSGSWLLTYDNSKEIRTLAREFGFATKRVRMRTAHNSVKVELLINREFS